MKKEKLFYFPNNKKWEDLVDENASQVAEQIIEGWMEAVEARSYWGGLDSWLEDEMFTNDYIIIGDEEIEFDDYEYNIEFLKDVILYQMF
jgi:hypothetical protein